MFLKQLYLVLGMIFGIALFVLPASAEEVYPKGNTEDNTVFQYHRSGWVLIQPGKSGTLKWNCPSNAHIVSGGFRTRGISGNLTNGFRVVHSFPSSNRQWTLKLNNADDLARDVRIYVVCAE